MALSEKLSTIDTIENLATNKDFLGKLIVELNKGANDKGIYTKKGVDDELRKKANTADVYTKKNVNDELAKKADKNYVDTELGKKANTADVYTTTAADTAFVKATELKTKAAAKDVVDAITASSDFTGKVYTKTAADTAFVKATELKTKAAEKAVVDAITASSDFTGKVYTKTAADTAFVKATDLATKVAEKAVVDALIPELAKGADDNGVYTKKGVDNALKLKADTNAIPAAPDLSKYLETSKLGEEVKKSAVVDVLIPKLAKDDGTTGIYTKKGVDDALALKAGAADLANKANAADIYTKNDADGKFATIAALGSKADSADLAAKANAADVYTKIDANTAFVKTDGFNISTQADKGKALANAILAVQDGDKSVLVDKLEGFLAENAKAYSNNTKTARELLVPSAAEIAADPALQAHVVKIKTGSPEFKQAAQEGMSQSQIFDIPSDPNAPISADW